jgi:hypothetical protein
MVVILSGAKNLIESGTYTSEILRLTPQNKIIGHPLAPSSSPFRTELTFEVNLLFCLEFKPSQTWKTTMHLTLHG